MTQQQIITTPANSLTGDSPKAAFDKCNANFSDLYAGAGGGIVNILQFGADPTGAADSTAAINAAFASGATGIVIPPGTFKITSPLLFTQPKCTLFCYGLLQAASTFTPSVSPATNFVFSIRPSANNAVIYNLTIDGFYNGGTGPGTCLADGCEVLAATCFMYSPKITHFPNTGLALTSTSAGDSWIYQPFVTQINNGDFAYGSDTSFTADCIFINRADCVVIGGTARWGKIGVHVGASATTTNISEHHVYCGAGVGGSRVAARVDPISVQVEAGAGSIWFRNCYLDAGLINNFSPSAIFRDCFMLQNQNAAVFTNASMMQYFANGQVQPFQADYDFTPISVGSNNNPVNSAATTPITYPGNGGNFWTGDWTGVGQMFISSSQRWVGTVGVNRVQHQVQLGGAPGGFPTTATVPIQWDYKAQNLLQYNYQIGAINTSTIFPTITYIGNKGTGIIHQANSLQITSALGEVTGSISTVNLANTSTTGVGGQFSCNAATLAVGMCVFISGAAGGTGSITGYVNPTPYLISATNGSTTFTLTDINGAAIVTTVGTITMTMSITTLNVSNVNTGSVQVGYFVIGNGGGGVTTPCQIVNYAAGASPQGGNYYLNTVPQTVVSSFMRLMSNSSAQPSTLILGSTTKIQDDGAFQLNFITANTAVWLISSTGVLRPIGNKLFNIGNTTNLVQTIFTSAIQADILGTNTVAPTVASAATIAVTQTVSFVSGVTTINTINPPSQVSGKGGIIVLIPTGLWSTGVTGNIALATTAVVNKALILTFDQATSKWYPSY